MSTMFKGYEFKNDTWKYIGFGRKDEKEDMSKKMAKKVKKLNAKKNNTSNATFVGLCRYDKQELKAYLAEELKKYYRNVISNDGFLFVKGTDKVCLTAHMDTTGSVDYGKRELVKDVYEYVEDGKHVLYSPQGIGGDDRCGVYMILKVLETTNYRPYIVFCEDEEIGCVGSHKFAKSKFIDDLQNVNFVIQLDRHGDNDAVFYDDANDEFHKWVEDVTGYKEANGTCSDISEICPACGISGVNLSCGYYNEHHDYETVKLEEMERTYEATVKLIEEGISLKEPFEYVDMYYGLKKGYGYGYDSWYGYDYSSNSHSYMPGYDGNTYALYITWEDRHGNAKDEYYEGLDSIAEGWAMFYFDNPDTCFNNVLDFEEIVE